MGDSAVTRPLRIAGRVEEQRLLDDAIQGAAGGEPCAMFVHGEAGVGKTHLVTAVSERAAASGSTVLWGRCVRFGSVEAPLLPLLNALDGWARSVDPAERSQVLATVDAVSDLLPWLGGRGSAAPVRLVTVVDALVTAIARHRPTVLVVDDLQWADSASRDALAYLVTGFNTQRLALLTTHRDEALVAGHPLHGWLADLRRLPSVTELHLDRLTRAEAVEALRAGLDAALSAGATNTAVFLAASLSRDLLMLGRLAESAAVLREGLSMTGVANGAASVRLGAALLATRRGDLRVAELHVRRARELVPVVAERPGLEAPPTLAEYLLAAGRPEEALTLLSRTMAVQSIDPRVTDLMLMWGARAAADIAERARDRGDRVDAERAAVALDDLLTHRQSLPDEAFAVIAADDPVQPAVEALFHGEASRCRGLKLGAEHWEEAARRCEAAGLGWEQHIATWRWVQAVLGGGGSRSQVTAPLRSVHRYATAEGADPLRQEAEALARAAHIRLDEPVGPLLPDDASGTVLGTLTNREREVLTHLVAGRTYAEIGGALFISEKTVSVHVSNLLRKTGTTSRAEVSSLARRLGQQAARDGWPAG